MIGFLTEPAQVAPSEVFQIVGMSYMSYVMIYIISDVIGGGISLVGESE